MTWRVDPMHTDVFARDRWPHYASSYGDRLGVLRGACRDGRAMADYLVVAAVHAQVASLLGPLVRADDLMAAFADTWKGDVSVAPCWFLATKALMFMDLLRVCARDHPVAGSAALFVEELMSGRAPKWSPGDIDVWHTQWEHRRPRQGPWASRGDVPPPNALQRRLIDGRWFTHQDVEVVDACSLRVMRIDHQTYAPTEQVSRCVLPYVQARYGIPRVVTWKLWFGAHSARQAVQIVWQSASHVAADCDCLEERARLCSACAKRATSYYGYGAFEPKRPDRSFDLDVAAVTARLVNGRIVLERDLARVPGRIHLRAQGLCVFDPTLKRIRETWDEQSRLRDRIAKYRARGMCDEVLLPLNVCVDPFVADGSAALIDVAPVAANLAIDGWMCVNHFDRSTQPHTMIGYLLVAIAK